MDWQRIWDGLAEDWPWIDNGLTDWQRIGNGLAADLRWIGGSATDWQFGGGLVERSKIDIRMAMDWRWMVGLVMDDNVLADW